MLESLSFGIESRKLTNNMEKEHRESQYFGTSNMCAMLDYGGSKGLKRKTGLHHDRCEPWRGGNKLPFWEGIGKNKLKIRDVK